MNEEFYKDSKTDIVEQINANNNTHITPDNVKLGIVNSSRAVVGDGVKYSYSAPLDITPRDLRTLVGPSPIIPTDLDITSGTIKVKDLIPVVNKAVGSNISVDDIMNGDIAIPAAIPNSPAVVVSFVGNRVSLVNDFDVIFIKSNFSLSDWAAESTNQEIIS